MSAVSENEMFASPDTWLLNLGYISEISEQNLLLYGFISTKGVVDVELMIDVDGWLIKYAVILDTKSYKKYKRQKILSKKEGLLNKLLLLLSLKVSGSYNPELRIKKCVSDYAGSKWKTHVEVIDVRQYNERTRGKDSTENWLFKDGTS